MKKELKKYLNQTSKFDKLTLIGIACLVAIISGLFGWVYEFIFYYFNSGMKEFYFRGGNFLPWINIYAYGAFIIILLTYKLRKKPLLVFLISFFACGILEYISGAIIYQIEDGVMCWSYNQEILNFGNIGGFVCLRSATFFGLSGLLLMYGILPFVFYLARTINKKTFLIITISIFSIILLDDLYNLIIAGVFNTPRASDIYKSIGFKYIYFYD